LNFDFVYNLSLEVKNFLALEETIYVKSRLINVNAIIYTINQDSVTGFLSHRNSGFAFEPGFFSFFINLAILINFSKRGFRFNKRFAVYFVALLTTQSTTGLVGLLAILLLFTLSRKEMNILRKSLVVSSFALITAFFLLVDFGYEKVLFTFLERESVTTLEYRALRHQDRIISLGRIGGFEYMFLNTMDKSPIFGFMGMERKGFDKDYIENIGVANGTAVLIYNFGLFGFFLFLYALYKSSKAIMNFELGLRNRFFFFFFFNLYLFSFPFVSSTFFFIIALFYLKYNK